MWFFKKKPEYGVMDIGLTADVHSHILPGVDDGSQEAKQSVDILRELHRFGVRKVMFTPHVSRAIFPNEAADLRKRMEAFLPLIPAELTSDMQFFLGSEYMVDEFFGHITDRLRYPCGQILIEMSYYERSREIKDTIFNLVMDGIRPVLAHPERYVFYQKVFDRKKGVEELINLVDMGCELQLNIMSLTGAYGERSLAIVHWLLDQRLYSYIGTDVHSRHQLDVLRNFKLDAAQMEAVRLLARNNERLFETDSSH